MVSHSRRYVQPRREAITKRQASRWNATTAKTPHKLSRGSTKLNDPVIKTCTRACRSRFSSPRIPINIPKCEKVEKPRPHLKVYASTKTIPALHMQSDLSSFLILPLVSWPVPHNRFGELMGTYSHIPNTLSRFVANVLYTGLLEFAKIVEFSFRSSQSSPLREHVPDSIYFVAIPFFIGGLTAVYLQQSGWMNGGARNEIQLPVLFWMRDHLYMTISQHRVAIFVPQLSTCCHMHSPVRITGVRYVPRILTGMFLEFSVSFPSSKVDLPCSHAPKLLVSWPEKIYQSEWMTQAVPRFGWQTICKWGSSKTGAVRLDPWTIGHVQCRSVR